MNRFSPEITQRIFGFKISRQGIIPLPVKVQAIKDIALPTYDKQLRSFIGCE